VPHEDTDFHERLQGQLYRHALDLLDHRVDVILEDGLWTRAERSEKLTAAAEHGAYVVMHVFDVSVDTLWARLEARNADRLARAYPVTRAVLVWALGIFEPPTPEELVAIDEVHRHT
jgi:predicted kinase